MIYSNKYDNSSTELSITSLGSQIEEQWSCFFPPTLLQRNKSSGCHFYNQYQAIVFYYQKPNKTMAICSAILH